jgi:hypothetical protein
MTVINDSAVATELTELYLKYEKALCTNDIETLDNLFWDAPEVVRFGVTENLYGSDEVRAFRKGRSPVNIDREIFNLKVVTFDADTAAVTLEFRRAIDGVVQPPRRLSRCAKHSFHCIPETVEFN